MGHSAGFRWDDHRKDVLDLYLSGIKNDEASKILSARTGTIISSNAYRLALMRFKNLEAIAGHILRKDDLVKTYKEPTLPEDDYILSCDYHSPYHSEKWLNRLLAVAAKFGIKKHIIVGDLFDFDFIKYYYSEEPSNLEREIKGTSPLIKALDFFDMNYLIQGNHERRVGIGTNSKIQAQHLFGNFGAEIWAKKFQYSIYDKMMIGASWMVVHPKSYSQVSASVAVRFAEKYHRHIINAHGHFIAMRFDRSGKYMAVDLGGIFEPSKIDYCSLSSTTHPVWNQGFGMLYRGHLYVFDDSTDWEFWLGGTR